MICLTSVDSNIRQPPLHVTVAGGRCTATRSFVKHTQECSLTVNEQGKPNHSSGSFLASLVFCAGLPQKSKNFDCLISDLRLSMSYFIITMMSSPSQTQTLDSIARLQTSAMGMTCKTCNQVVCHLGSEACTAHRSPRRKPAQ
jgi:hypothetical protein